MSFRVAYFGLPLGAYLLHRDGHELSVVVLSPVAAPGRRRLAGAVGSERVLDAERLGVGLDAAVARALAANPPDLLVSWFWTRKLPERWLSRARLGGIGAHPSLLPRHRGPNPYFAAIDAGDLETGVTIHRLTPEYDDGDVLLSRSLVVGERNAWQLARALDRPSLALLREAVAAYASGTPPPPARQSPELVTWAPEPTGDALRVAWSWPTERVLQRIRALSPVPGLALDIEGQALSVTQAEKASDYPSALEPGEAAVYGDPPRLLLRTGDGAVAVTRAVLEAEDGAPDVPSVEESIAHALQAHLSRARPPPRG